jgi:hypothetical protein
MSRGVVYTLHLWPPIAHAKHYTGTARDKKRLPERLADHALGRGARLTQVQVERGGSWVLAQTQPGDRTEERRLKQHGAARRCTVCQAIKGYQTGELSQEQALARVGWDGASQHERGLLLDMLGISQPPERTPAPQPSTAGAEVRMVPAPRPAPAAQVITPEIVALVDQLDRSWNAGAGPQPGAQARHAAPEIDLEPQA